MAEQRRRNLALWCLLPNSPLFSHAPARAWITRDLGRPGSHGLHAGAGLRADPRWTTVSPGACPACWPRRGLPLVAAACQQASLTRTSAGWRWCTATCCITRPPLLPHVLQPKYRSLARFVLENNYVECQGIEGAFLQKIGTAMGTSF